MVSWSYEFRSEKSIYEMEPLFNEMGSWHWRVRDCAWYPDFLQAYPGEGARLCIYLPDLEIPTHYRALIEADSEAKRPLLDNALQTCLEKLAATQVVAGIGEPWPFD